MRTTRKRFAKLPGKVIVRLHIYFVELRLTAELF
ncbi:hypothetical protein GB2207_07821 [marine gamma proteobacterium HTCC2207]|uniref:Uncharacterized protein n=1 Tax=gamma proteobacterium HTCC2207 TaxID=314287 RepID=Q1YVK9_9GAMM|nr:hypothetical protein GB2207_07821 [marine gamma proteobacterium HTCC2207] [gamma proteobacterium HTCC2207]